MWDNWYLMFPLGIVTGWCFAYLLRGWRQVWVRPKNIKTELKR